MPKDQKDQSPRFFYVCEHGASNEPCAKFCHFDAVKRQQPPTMPDDWQETYEPPPAPEGAITDSATAQPKK